MPESRTQPLIELEILLRNILIGADDVVRGALDETFPRSDLLDLFRAASSCPADEHGEMTQVFREVCPQPFSPAGPRQADKVGFHRVAT